MKEAIRKVGDALLSFGGFAFTIICGAVGCLNLPPAFSNWWRFAIFVGLLTCYVIVVRPSPIRARRSSTGCGVASTSSARTGSWPLRKTWSLPKEMGILNFNGARRHKSDGCKTR